MEWWSAAGEQDLEGGDTQEAQLLLDRTVNYIPSIIEVTAGAGELSRLFIGRRTNTTITLAHQKGGYDATIPESPVDTD